MLRPEVSKRGFGKYRVIIVTSLPHEVGLISFFKKIILTINSETNGYCIIVTYELWYIRKEKHYIS